MTARGHLYEADDDEGGAGLLVEARVVGEDGLVCACAPTNSSAL